MKLYSVKLNKRFFVFAIIISFYVLFHSLIEVVVVETIIPVLSHVESIWYNDIVVLFVTLLLFFSLITAKRQYSVDHKIYTGLFLIVYFIYRFFFQIWIYVPFSFFDVLKYSDSLILLLIPIFIPRKKKSSVNTNNSFVNDSPINDSDTDGLDYSGYAIEVASRINNSSFETAFAIGINGKWGYGKSSFINLIQQNLNKEDIIEIHFSPWNNNQTDSIIKDFFETLQESIKPYYSSLSRVLVNYSNKLVSIDGKVGFRYFQYFSEKITGIDSINSLHVKINGDLERINKKIIIYIDDLDRLNKDEILAVLQLIRNTANFYNTFFIVAYDREYILNEIEANKFPNNNNYLEKFFQLEISLPYFDRRILKQKVIELLKEKISVDEIFFKEIEEVINGAVFNSEDYAIGWIDNMRDVLRITNHLILNIEKLKSEIVFSDFFKLELLRMKYPFVYETIKHNRLDYLKTEANFDGRNNYNLKGDNNLVLKLKIQFPLLQEQELEKINALLEMIFSANKGYSQYSTNEHLSVKYPSKFNNYFQYQLGDRVISEVEFSKAKLSENFHQKISEWILNGKENDLLERFYLIEEYDSKDDFEKIIKAIFFLANQKSKSHENNLRFGNRIFFNFDNLLRKLNNYENIIGIKYYNGKNELLEAFVTTFFETAQSPFILEALFIKEVNSKTHFYFPVDNEILNQFTIDYLRKYIKTIDKYDNILKELAFCTCTITRDRGPSKYRYPEETIKIIKDFSIEKDIEGFLRWVISEIPHAKNRYKLSNFILTIFETWEEFVSVIHQQDEINKPLLKEFKEYLKLCGNQFDEEVDFNFTSLK